MTIGRGPPSINRVTWFCTSKSRTVGSHALRGCQELGHAERCHGGRRVAGRVNGQRGLAQWMPRIMALQRIQCISHGHDFHEMLGIGVSRLQYGMLGEELLLQLRRPSRSPWSYLLPSAPRLSLACSNLLKVMLQACSTGFAAGK